MDIKLFFWNKNNIYLCNDDKLCCSLCGVHIDNIGFLKIFHFRNRINLSYFCSLCSYANKDILRCRAASVLNFMIVKELPIDSQPIIDFTIDLRPIFRSDDEPITVFDIDEINKRYPESKTIDKTKLALKESCGGCQIGKDVNSLLEQKEKALDSKELVNIFSSKVYIEKVEDEVKKIEKKEEQDVH